MLLVTGARGNVGGEVLAAVADGDEPVCALVRSSSSVLASDVPTVVGDLDNLDSLTGVFDGVRAVFLLAGYADMPGLVALMRECGVEHVVLLSSGAVEGGEVTNAVTRFNMVSEAAVIDSGLTYTILRPSGFMSNALRWLDQLAAGDVVEEPFAEVPIAAIDPADIGAVAALALTGPEHENQVFRLTGPATILPADRLRVLGDVLGRQLQLRPLSDEEARNQMTASMPTAMADAFLRYFADGTYDDSRVLPTVRDVLGREPHTFQQWAHAHRDEFAGQV